MSKRSWRETHQQIKEWKHQKATKKEEKMKQQLSDETANDLAEQNNNELFGRNWTSSVAIPSSIVDNAQSPELKTYLCGEIARALVVFNIDEIVVFDDYANQTSGDNEETLLFDKRNASMVQMVRILQYLECPQYLRKYLFPIQKDLQYVGLLNPLDSTHHLRTEDICNYREGVVINRPVKEGKGSYVYVGLQKQVQIDKCLESNIRLTVKFDPNQNAKKKLKGIAVSPSAPRTESGLYWGYNIRIAKSLSAVFTESPHEEGYDLTIGTSDKGDNIDKSLKKIPKSFSHLLIVFGGLKGLEAAHECDQALSQVEDTRDLFNYYLNTCPNQGSNTIRTEEAVLITLSALRRRLLRHHR